MKYKIKINKDLSFRGVDYVEGETYEVSRKVKNFFVSEDAIAKPTKKKKQDKEIKE